MENLFDLFAQRARKQPGHPALVGPGKDDGWTYAQLLEAIEDMAARFRDAGFGRGHTLGLHCRSGREYIVFTYVLSRPPAIGARAP